jgi:DNA-binding ferritin-like protein
MTHNEILNQCVATFFIVQLLIKLYHWNTKSYARHKATDKLLEKLSDLIDKFIEVYIGTFNVRPNAPTIKLDHRYLTDEGITELLNAFKIKLNKLTTLITNTDLLNIRDEMLAEVNQTLYLFQLN